MTIIIFFTLGLIVGSFLNVVVYRLNVAETILGRSHCPHCKKQIRWYDNVPLLSFVILAGKCRDCEKKISWQYPLMEFLTGVVFALAGLAFFALDDPGTWLVTAFYLAVFSLLMIIAAYDLKYLEIPMLILWIGVALTIGYLLYVDWSSFDPQSGILALGIFSGALAAAGAFLFFFALSAGSREKWMGMGDAYMALLVGLIAGWPLTLLALFIAFTSGALVGLGLIFLKKKNLQSQVPFAPFLALGVFAAVILAHFFGQISELFFWTFL